MTTVRDQRESLIRHFFPEGMPNLWCPALTHVRDDGSFDTSRMEKQLGRVADFCNAWLMFGPTGNGDQLSDDDVISLLECASQAAARNNAFLFVGAICDSVDQGLQRANRIVNWIRDAWRPTDSAATANVATN
ncbi:hypothetical protein ACFL2H_09160, partial [Planctomycetota bacterium]